MIRFSPPRTCTLFTAALVLASCRGQPVVVVVPEESDRCLVGSRDTSGDTIFVAVDSVFATPATVIPRTDTERLVFRQIYESLVAVDCDGRVRPGVAESWVMEADGRTWTFRLGDARFSDGVRVTALHVLDAWERVWPRISTSLPSGEYFNFEAAVSDDVIVIVLEQPNPDFPRKLARPDLAVARYDAIGEAVWPVGTTGVKPVPSASAERILLAGSDENYPMVVFAPLGSTDPRDALDANLDVVIGGGRAFLDYAQRRSGYSNYPLPWDRAYGLAMFRMRAAREAPARDDWWARLSASRGDIARNAVGVDARASSCTVVASAPDSALPSLPSPLGMVLYELRDRTAGEIAERIVATDNARRESVGANDRLRAQGVSDSEFVRRIAEGGVAGVFAARSPEPTPCDFDPPIAAISGASSIVLPLIQTRRHIVIRDGQVSATVHGDGVVQFVPLVGR